MISSGVPSNAELLAGEVGIGMRADVLVALGARSARQVADGLQHLGSERIGLLALRLGLDDLQCARDAPIMPGR